MKFRTRLQITFLSIILVPFISTVVAFLLIGIFLMGDKKGFNHQGVQVSDSFTEFAQVADEICESLVVQVKNDKAPLEDPTYLDEKNMEYVKKSVSLLVMKGDRIYFNGNPDITEEIIDSLPVLDEAMKDDFTDFYYNKGNRYVRLMYFDFSDGTEGRIYVIIKNNRLISKQLLIPMLIAIMVILVFTAIVLTLWIHKGVFIPIYQLNEAMSKIKDGNFDYMLQTTDGGEIGALYQNYEDMRLRLKESAEEKVQNEQDNREMISNISHDLKTPITAIKGYVEGIMDGVADTPEKVDKYIKTIYNKANDMDRLINELTLYSGIDNNRIPYNYHRINVADYFGDCIEEVGLDLESKNIQLNYTNLVDSDTKVIADPEQMKKVINNIISNSVKYMDKQKGVIDIRIIDQGESIQIEIEDNGRGIEQKNLSRVFERFYRTDASRNSAQGGSGIGLSIVKKIIEDHGGYIWATSKIGEGTCMHFVLRKYKELQNDNINI